jgi:eukaryotic translation initiation factor 2C
VFFRDGVSEGEFAIVRERELNAMKGRFSCVLLIADNLSNLVYSCHQGPIEKHYGPQQNWPQLVFIVVGKRHHFRFFPDPKSGAGADPKGNGNLFPGFVVDQGKFTRAFKIPRLKNVIL